MRATGKPPRPATTVATTTATSEAGKPRCRRGSTAITTTTKMTKPVVRYESPGSPTDLRTACAAVRSTPDPEGTDTPSAAGTCWSAITVAMPTVNPSTTGHGTKATKRPRPLSPSTTNIAPASTATTATPAAPNAATIGSRTTVIAPVGPDTC